MSPIKALPEVIETLRLRLRPYRFEDLDEILAYANDREWGRYLPVPVPYARQDAIEFLARQILADRLANPSWAIEHQGINIGGINIRLQFDNRLAELGYSIAPAFWNQGLVTEAARTIIDVCFRAYPELNRIRAMADARNTASLRVMEKLGMRAEGVLRQNRIIRGETMDEAWYGLLRGEWRPQTIAPDT